MADADTTRSVTTPKAFALWPSVGPARWVGDRSPRHAWIDDALVWRGRERGTPVTRVVRQDAPGRLRITGDADPALDVIFMRDVLAADSTVDRWDDPLLATLGARYPGLAPYSDGSLWEGIVTSIVGQSISVASAAVTQRRLALLFDPGIEIAGRVFAPLPSPELLAEATVERIRTSGVTTRRADALHRIARMAADGELPSDADARRDPAGTERALLALPLVGPWTALSALHWGVGAPDAWPPNDVALLRAVRIATGDDTLTMRDIDAMAESWRPNRGVAARLLWANLFEPVG